MKSDGLVLRQISKIARRNVLRNWRQSLSTILAVTAGFAAVALFDGFMASLDEILITKTRQRAMLGDISIQLYGALEAGRLDAWEHAMNPEQQKFVTEFLRQDPDVLKFTKMLDVVGMVSGGQQSAVFAGLGYELEPGGAIRGDQWFWNTMAGVPLEKAKEPSLLLASGLGRVVGCDVAVSPKKGNFVKADGSFLAEDRPFKCVSDQVSLTVTTEAGQASIASFPVSGIHDSGVKELEKRQAMMDLATAQQILDTDKISTIKVLLRDPSKADDVISRLKAAEAGMPFHLEAIKTFNHPMIGQIVRGLNLQHTIRNIFLTVVVFIVIMAVTNTMMKAVKERTREIGTLRSIGFLRRHIVAMFSLEGLYLSLFACIGGLGLTFVLRELVHLAEIKFSAGLMTIPVSIRVINLPVTWAATGMVMVVLATLTANLASRRAATMVIADAMRDN